MTQDLTNQDLPELRITFSHSIPHLDLRQARNPTSTDYCLLSGDIPAGLTLGETWENEETGEMWLYCYGRISTPVLGALHVEYIFPDE